MIFLHVIGLVGAGKSTFIKKHLDNYPCFDIQSIYTQNHINPQTLKHPERYQQYFALLRQAFEEFVHHCQAEKGLIGIIESSGANHGLNQILRKHLSYVIWIQPDLNRLQDPEFIAMRPYAPELNTYLLDLYTKHRLHRIDAEFNPDTLTFQPNLPAPLRSIFPDFRPYHLKVPPLTDSVEDSEIEVKGSYFHAKAYRCPGCGAKFSKNAYLQLHFSRMPRHQHPELGREKKLLIELGAMNHVPKKFLS